ncbi:MAG: glycosyltransferase family 2 protein, partial [Phycisphaerales bacterium]|nr:glycosyltransferase family 2 protein [Phycisphaerales bacterium]
APMGAAPDAGTSTDAARPAAQAEPKLGVHASLRVVAVVPSHGRAPDVVAVLGDLARVPREVVSGDAEVRRVELSVIVVDTASEPALRVSAPGLEVRTIRLRENVGGAGGFSAGIAAALREDGHDANEGRRHDLVWLVDSDARVEPDALTHLVRALDADANAVAAGAAIVDPESGLVHECGGRISRVSGVMRPARMGDDPADHAPREPFEVDYVAACCALVRTSAIERTGLWRDLFISHDDAEWFVRLARANAGRVLAVPAAQATHPVFGRGITWQRYYSARNAMQPLRALGRSWWSPARRGLRAACEVVRAARCAMRGEGALASLHMDGLRDGLHGDFARRGRMLPNEARGARGGVLSALGCIARGVPLALGHAMSRPHAAQVWTEPALRACEASVGGDDSASSSRGLDASDLSIIVLSYRRVDALVRTLAAISNDPDLRGAEIIVVDNASRDGTVERVAREFSSVRLIETDANLGVEAFNCGVTASTRDIVLILDDDATPDTGAVRRALDMLSGDPWMAAVTLHPRHPRDRRSEWRFASSARGASHNRERDISRDWPVMGCANLLRRSCWNAVGGYERGFFLYRNDADLALKLLACGWGVGFDPTLVVWHDSPFAARKSARWCQLATRNWLWMCKRHGARGSGVLAGAMGWAWAHRLAGLGASRQCAVLRGAMEGLFTRTPKMDPTCAPTGRDLARLLRLQMTRAGSASMNNSSSDRHSA